MSDSVTVGIAMHKPYEVPDDDIYLPLHVGAALHPDVLQDIQGDDTGDNISERNPFYSELTGLYWLWKNCDSDYKGLVHYRRYLGSPSFTKRHARNRYDRILTTGEALELLKDTDILVGAERHYYIESVYSHYAHTFHASQFDETRKVLLELAPDYVPAWDRLMQSTSAHLFNVFIMRADLFDAYCAWMFSILFELEKRIDPSQYDAFNARYLGRISERLLDPWLETNGYSYKELPVTSPEPTDWWKKGTGFLAAKFKGDKYTKSF